MNSSIHCHEYENKNDEGHFTYHKESSYTAFVWAMISVSLIEAVGVSFLLIKWSPILHWIHLSLSIFVIAFLLADLRAVKKHPITLENDILSLKIGIRRTVKIPVKHIKEIRKGNLHYENDRKNKDVLDLSLIGLADPTFEVVLENPVENKGLFGKVSHKKRIFFTVDNQQTFYNAVKKNQQDVR
ncbi:hypothetical protein [Niallia endozanthoxylica]|uniref:Uncharacterized protein n=1 Tax=Niallia endozanthoxylica TaxID=2036016 RepID=A0A5J5HSI4_9BACI|nr:hypothetical protein [Niallia endozanthoxylica]KAA9023821.1 hypothetical protein F4V44_11805 [Niallia endozanthoxylica]